MIKGIGKRGKSHQRDWKGKCEWNKNINFLYLSKEIDKRKWKKGKVTSEGLERKRGKGRLNKGVNFLYLLN